MQATTISGCFYERSASEVNYSSPAASVYGNLLRLYSPISSQKLNIEGSFLSLQLVASQASTVRAVMLILQLRHQSKN